MATTEAAKDDPQAEHEHTLATWDALLELGFVQVEDNWCCPSMVFNFGRFKLQATQMMNLYLREVIVFSGTIFTSRFFGEIKFEMPLKIESIEQCAAWIACHLKDVKRQLEELSTPEGLRLLRLGLEHQDSLPWVRAAEQRRIAYEARPWCSAERSWLRQALNAIKTHISNCPVDARIVFGFDGQLLTFRGENWIAPIPATGTVWPNQYEILVSNLHIPPRLMQEKLVVEVWEENLRLGRQPCGNVRVLGADSSDANGNDALKS